MMPRMLPIPASHRMLRIRLAIASAFVDCG
jgi:hypothetical protein